MLRKFSSIVYVLFVISCFIRKTLFRLVERLMNLYWELFLCFEYFLLIFKVHLYILSCPGILSASIISYIHVE